PLSDENEIPVFREELISPVTSPVFQEEKNDSKKIKTEEQNVFIETPSAENIFKEDFSDSETKQQAIPGEETVSDVLNAEAEFPVQNTWRHQEISATIHVEEKNIDPHEVIRKRLSEILGKIDYAKPKITQPEADTRLPDEKIIKDVEPESLKAKEDEKNEPVAEIRDDGKSDEEQIISKQAGQVRDVIDKIGLEHALEETIIHSIEKLPVIRKEESREGSSDFSAPVPQREYSDQDTHSFMDWLHLKAGKDFGNMEEVHARSILEVETEEDFIEEKENAPSNISKDELISQFIATEPRIIPSKAEFYSPVNQAKKSIAEHEDVVSETLARIYFNQGNLLKARSGYKKLSLLHPEKSSYFAALIQEIDNLLNKQE